MTDKELLEYAAKAAEIRNIEEVSDGGVWHRKPFHVNKTQWNPLTDDGDALRLAVKLFFEIDIGLGCIAIRHLSGIKILESFNNNPYAATRRAIVRAAAEIGKEMK